MGRKGFHEMRLEDIAAEAGFSKASLYNYYSDREEIVLTLAIRAYETMFRQIQNQIDRRLPLEKNMEIIIREVVANFQDHFAIIMTRGANPTFSLCSGATGKHEKQTRQFQRLHGRLPVLFEQLIIAAKKRMEVSSPLEATVLSRFFMSLLWETIRDWRKKGHIENPSQALRDILDFVRQGFGMPKKTGAKKS
jgi:AcrR family transcriptional regulator